MGVLFAFPDPLSIGLGQGPALEEQEARRVTPLPASIPRWHRCLLYLPLPSCHLPVKTVPLPFPCSPFRNLLKFSCVSGPRFLTRTFFMPLLKQGSWDLGSEVRTHTPLAKLLPRSQRSRSLTSAVPLASTGLRADVQLGESRPSPASSFPRGPLCHKTRHRLGRPIPACPRPERTGTLGPAHSGRGQRGHRRTTRRSGLHLP